MKDITVKLVVFSLILTTPCFARQTSTQPSQPPVRAEDPAYYEDPRSVEVYTVDEVNEEKQPAARAPAKQKSQSGPVYLEDMEKRKPATQQPGRMTTTGDKKQPERTQLAFFELTPTFGSISINDNTAFSMGAQLSFRMLQEPTLYFEPSAMASFVSGRNQNATVFHIDGGVRWDFAFAGSPIIPFLKGAIGPSFTTNQDTIINDAGDQLGDTYFNLFAGGGIKVLINPHVGARLDMGLTIQEDNPGLYFFGSVVLPL